MRRCLLFPVLALAAVVSLAAPSCLSPTIPLPPPDAPSTIRIGATPGTWEVFGDCTPGALVMVVNDKIGKGVIVEDRAETGSYSVILEGDQCDVGHVEEEIGVDHSAPRTFVLAPRTPSDPAESPLCH